MKFIKGSDLIEFPIFEDVLGKIVFSSDNVMLLLVEIPPRGVVSEHSHPHEQMGICLRGKAEFRSETEKRIVDEGTFYWINSGEKHSVLSLIDDSCLFLDVFHPPRKDYIKKLSNLESKE